MKPVFVVLLIGLLAAGGFLLTQSRSTVGPGEFVVGSALGTRNEYQQRSSIHTAGLTLRSQLFF